MRSLFAMFFMMEKGIMPRFHLLQINAKGNVMCPESKRPPPEEVAFQNAPYKGGKCHIPFSTLATPSAVHVFVPSFPDASHIV
ncbi:hypothetical protein [Salmonella enterica]|uniref:hypothetical protein n=1 Tax=Salmonella enterica TaxID=28901 RepID=UPI001F4CE6B6|nr:hypothetical protein [Salmonella enterica]UNE07589.1 hypothetical protein IAR35_20295 [Salmonella enterica]